MILFPIPSREVPRRPRGLCRADGKNSSARFRMDDGSEAAWTLLSAGALAVLALGLLAGRVLMARPGGARCRFCRFL